MRGKTITNRSLVDSVNAIHWQCSIHKKDTLILLYNEIVEELQDLEAMEKACIPQDEGENDN